MYSVPVPAATTSPAAPAKQKASPADRLLDAATALFAAHGIRAVGIDRIIGEAGVARASLYSAFGSKDALVTEYLRRLDLRDRRRFEDAALPLASPLDRVLALFDLAISSAPVRNYRGCQYLNAATEFPGELDSMLGPVREHRDWLHEQLTHMLTEAGRAGAPLLATKIQTIYDGALAGSKFSCSEEPIRVGRAMVEELLGA